MRAPKCPCPGCVHPRKKTRGTYRRFCRGHEAQLERGAPLGPLRAYKKRKKAS